jgi:hypothetical protein
VTELVELVFLLAEFLLEVNVRAVVEAHTVLVLEAVLVNLLQSSHVVAEVEETWVIQKLLFGRVLWYDQL